MSDRNDLGVIGAFLLGGIIGAAAGLLLAPAKGEDTREKIKDWAGDKFDESKDKLEDLKDNIEKKLAGKKKSLGKKLSKFKEDVVEAVLNNNGEN